MTELELDDLIQNPPNRITDTAESVRTETNFSTISDTVTDMSILQAASTEDDRSCVTPPLHMTETVKRLKMALQKQTILHQNHGLTKFPYVSDPVKSKAVVKYKDGKLTEEQKTVQESLNTLKSQDLQTIGKIKLEKKVDSELFDGIVNEYDKLRLEINQMKVEIAKK